MGLLSSFRAVVAQKMDDNPAVVTCHAMSLAGGKMSKIHRPELHFSSCIKDISFHRETSVLTESSGFNIKSRQRRRELTVVLEP